jgi:hypothetical protein
MDTMRPVRFVPADAGSKPVYLRRTAMRSPRSTFAMIAVAALASVFALSMFGGSVGAEKISPRDTAEKVDPEGCPPGWEQATHPLNPQLGCLPTQEKAGGGFEKSDPGSVHCPEGTVPATPPLNPELGCIPATLTANVVVEFHPDTCPEGWVPAEPPLNPDLGCLPNTFVTP